MACVVNPGIPDDDIRTLHLGACRQPNATSVMRSLLLCADHERPLQHTTFLRTSFSLSLLPPATHMCLPWRAS